MECNAIEDSTDWSEVANGVGCGTDSVCFEGECSNGCWITDDDGGAYSDDGAKIGDCGMCDTSQSVYETTPVSDGDVCGLGMFCSEGECLSGCWIDETYIVPDTYNGACQLCNPASNPGGWTNAPGGTYCGTGLVCNGALCSEGCWIDKAFVEHGEPGQACTECDGLNDPYDWSVSADGTACGDGSTCQDGECQSCFEETNQIGAQTNHQYGMISTFNTYSYSQTIYTKAELTAVGILPGDYIYGFGIKAIKTGNPSLTSSTNVPIDIYMINTTSSTFTYPTAQPYEWFNVNTGNIVFSHPVNLNDFGGTTSKWIWFDFDTPFEYTGAGNGNIVIAVNAKGGMGFSSTGNMVTFEVTNKGNIYRVANIKTGGPYNPLTINTTMDTVIGLTNHGTNIRFRRGCR